MSAGQSIFTPSDEIPLPAIWRLRSITSVAPTSTFFGSHPRNAHVPPNGLESTIATCHPAERHLDAAADAPDPVPIAMRSNFLVMRCSLLERLPIREIVHFPSFVSGFNLTAVCCT